MSNNEQLQNGLGAQSGIDASNCLTALEVIEAIKSWENNQNPGYQIRKKFIVVFNVDKDILTNLDRVITRRFETEYGTPAVEVMVRYSNSMSETYRSFNDFLESGGNCGIPESVTLTWRCRSSNGGKVECQIEFVTEQQLQIANINSVVSNRPAEIELSIQSDGKTWANDTFVAISTRIDQVKSGGISKPFQYFRSPTAILVCVLVIFICSYVVTMNFLTRLIVNPGSKENYSTILSDQPMEEKFNQYIQIRYIDSLDNTFSFLPGIVGFLIGGTLSILSAVSLHKLVPKSWIVIGLPAEKARKEQGETYKYIIFMILVPAILMAFLAELIRGIFGLF